MEIVLVVFAFLFLLAGLLGSVIPIIPGPPLGYIGLMLLQWSGRGGFSTAFLIVWAMIVITVTVIDNILPAWLTKRFGGSRMAVFGSVLGLIIGMFVFSLLVLLIGPFLGALTGELINLRITNAKTSDVKALKTALGAFLAFILGTGAKLIVGAWMIFFAVRALIN
jgi:uncharacterized protein YqgC (DUF456 family)